jgi:ABC-2 type transport system permease protein
VNRTQRLLNAASVIARRDYVATVWSRSFLLFLIGPMIAALFGGVLGKVGAQTDGVALQPIMIAVVDAQSESALKAAHDQLDKRIGDIPALRFVRPSGAPDAQARALLNQPKGNIALVMTGWPTTPKVTGPRKQVETLTPMMRLIMEHTLASEQLARIGVRAPSLDIGISVVDPAAGNSSTNRYFLARTAQTILFVLTILLAGMLLSNLVEEKSNKVIEVLAAAVPVDAIFLGKLVAMLGVSLTGITIWGALIAGGVMAAFDGGPIPQPGIGWPLFVVLGAGYYVMNYMILGGLFLGIGSQAATVRDVQTLSMPITMAQIAIFAAGSAVVNDLDKPMGLLAAIFPLTSPLTMIARAAQESALWPHLLALGWQALWVVFIIRFAARRFRTGVLKSGSPPRQRHWFRKTAETGGEAVVTPRSGLSR